MMQASATRPVSPQRARRAITAAALFCGVLTATGPALAAGPSVFIYALQPADLGGTTLPVIAPLEEPSLAGSSMALRPQRAFDALKARAPKAYGNTALKLDSATAATVLLDAQGAEPDQVVSEVYWTLVSMGFDDIRAPLLADGKLSPDMLGYGAHVLVLTAWDLLKFGQPERVPATAFVYSGGSPIDARSAAMKLSRGDKALRRALAAAVSGKTVQPKLAVIAAVQEPTSREAYKLSATDIAPALADRSLTVRSAALDAILVTDFGKDKSVIGALEKLVVSDSDTDLKLRAVKALSKAGIRKYDDLLMAEKLRTGTTDEALKAVEVLSKSAQMDIAAPALVSALSHSDATVRDAAFDGLVAMKQYDELFKAMDVDQLTEAMRERIAKVLVESGSAAARDKALGYLIKSASAGGAIFAAQTYGKLGAKSATPKLLEALKHESPQVRQAAAEALAAIKDERAITPLADAADKRARDKPYMMDAAEVILKTLRLDQVKRLVDSRNLTVKQMAIRALSGFAQGSRPRPDVVALLMKLSGDASADVKRSAIYALSRIKDDGIARDLSKFAGDSDAEVKKAVAYALGEASAKYPEADDVLMKMVQDRQAAADALEGIAKRKAAKALPIVKQRIRYPKEEVKRAAYKAMLALTTDANMAELRPLFRAGMKESDPQVRFACIEALGRGTTVEDLTSLRLAFFAPEKSVKLAAVKVLGASKLPQAMEIISLSFGEDDEAVLAAALDALIAIPVTPEWVAKKKRYLRDFTQMPNAPKDLKDKAAKAKP